MLFCEGERSHMRSFALLAGQALSSLGSSAADDAPSLFGGHSFAEAVPSCPFDPAWLICAFHFDNLRWSNNLDGPGYFVWPSCSHCLRSGDVRVRFPRRAPEHDKKTHLFDSVNMFPAQILVKNLTGRYLAGTRNSPLAPPLFSRRRTSEITMPRSTALHMS